MESSYLAASRSGVLEERITKSRDLLRSCSLCPRNCQVDRLAGDRGLCRTGEYAEVASASPHFGEESVLVGKHGSGTIFFCGCNLLCVFCQNYDISHPREQQCHMLDAKQLGHIMVELQEQGCHNINFVSPSHVIPQILASLPTAIDEGLRVPLVYNSGGYDSLMSLTLLDGIVDIYMPDFKFWREDSSNRYLSAKDYPGRAREALAEMQRQVGDLQLDKDGIARRGLLVRHLLMPGGADESEAIFDFLADTLSKNCYLNIMDQYHPCGKAGKFPELLCTIEPDEYRRAVKMAQKKGLSRIDSKDMEQLMRRLF